MRFANFTLRMKIGVTLVGVFATLPLMYAQQRTESRGGQPQRSQPQRSEPQRAAPARAPVAERRPVTVDRTNHGSIRHTDTHIVQRPVPAPRNFDMHHDVMVHRDVEADFQHHRFWHGFVYGRRLHQLPVGYFSLFVNGTPYFYDDGIYYQPANDGYQEVYPPVGADVPQPPDGAVAIDAGGITYYYAGGAFYVEQSDGQFAIAPTPIGVTVPELPPGAVEVSMSGGAAYQFNGIYYRPVFVDGVTQYVTFQP